MGISLRWSRAILSASLSTQTTSLPVSARQAPATRPTYPLPITATCMSRLFRHCVSSIHDQLGVAADHRVVEVRVIGYDHDAVCRRHGLGAERHRAILPAVLGKTG